MHRKPDWPWTGVGRWWTPRRALPALACLALVLAGCVQTRVSPPVVATTTDLFHAGPAILSGFDPEGEVVRWRDGDSALFGVEVHHGDSLTVRYVLITVQPPRPLDVLPSASVTFTMKDGSSRRYTSGLREIVIRLYDEAGTLLEENTGRIAVELAANGFFDAAEAVQGLDDINRITELDDVTVDRWARGILALLAIMDSINGNEGLSPLMLKIVRRPSLASIVFHTGISITVNPGFERASLEMVDGREVYRIPLEIRANDTLALVCSMDVLPVRTPRHLSAGVVECVARNPVDEERWARVRLLAARRLATVRE
ncbi:MAG: hypothetical protein KDA21_06790 [Phycisphaerales bacterium]|nr:hypothetical protein [Phycisphaerales bacterium]